MPRRLSAKDLERWAANLRRVELLAEQAVRKNAVAQNKTEVAEWARVFRKKLEELHPGLYPNPTSSGAAEPERTEPLPSEHTEGAAEVVEPGAAGSESDGSSDEGGPHLLLVDKKIAGRAFRVTSSKRCVVRGPPKARGIWICDWWKVVGQVPKANGEQVYDFTECHDRLKRIDGRSPRCFVD